MSSLESPPEAIIDDVIEYPEVVVTRTVNLSSACIYSIGCVAMVTRINSSHHNGTTYFPEIYLTYLQYI